MLSEELQRYRVLPVITAVDAELTVALCEALAQAGMAAVEITLRTTGALEAIRAVKAALPGLVVAAGTVRNPAELEQAIAAGCDFHVSPGLTPRLLEASREAGARLLPGVSSASDLMMARDHGIDCVKLFPAEAVGGIRLIKALAGPFPEMVFCPTGGLGPDNFRDYLALDNVACCGGSWMVAPELVSAARWDDVRHLAAEAIRP
jgi:2-dehydro-3-deoxyphosphogluconate aldolase/(4S)-4-hydroxy-2-oxoglutarate aldolase